MTEVQEGDGLLVVFGFGSLIYEPEWPEVLELQRGWLSQLQEHTGSDQEVLFEKMQNAINQVLGTENDVAVSLSLDEATEIVRTAVHLVLTAEAEQAQTSGRVN